jgi:hypothetical protein
MPARELYRSPLWNARRAFAERRTGSWFVLSAKYGLLDPDQPLAPYNVNLADLSARDRLLWAEAVVASLEWRLGNLQHRNVELHAGESYRRPLTPLLEAAGATVTAPTAAIKGIGNQLAWYRQNTHPERRRVATQDELAAALNALDGAAQLIPASAFPGDRDDLAQPGLYSWWVDEQGAAELTDGLGSPLKPGRIYAGVTGATSWPSAKTGTQTLRARLSTHILAQAKVIIPIRPNVLSTEDERELSRWIAAHLQVAVHPFPHADALAGLEDQMLARLDPPLNLQGMPNTDLRTRLRKLRAQLATPPAAHLEVSIGNSRDGYYRVEGDGNHLTYHAQTRDGNTGPLTLDPTTRQWEAFWGHLDQLNVWEWNSAGYETPDVLDGTYWQLTASHNGRHVTSSGANGYPDSHGPEPGPTFRKLCEAISELAGGRIFA